jgi:hypothetical protein
MRRGAEIVTHLNSSWYDPMTRFPNTVMNLRFQCEICYHPNNSEVHNKVTALHLFVYLLWIYLLKTLFILHHSFIIYVFSIFLSQFLYFIFSLSLFTVYLSLCIFLSIFTCLHIRYSIFYLFVSLFDSHLTLFSSSLTDLAAVALWHMIWKIIFESEYPPYRRPPVTNVLSSAGQADFKMETFWFSLLT